MIPGNLDIQFAQAVNGNFFNFYSNGGYGHLPNPVFEDQKTTDEYVARRIIYPSESLRTYYDDEKNSPFYTYDQNRVATFAQQYDSLAQKGVRLIGEEKSGQYSVYASQDCVSGSVPSAGSGESDSTHALLWVLVIVGAISLIGNAVA